MFGDQEERDVVDVGRELERGQVLLQDGTGSHDSRIGDHQVQAAGGALHLRGHGGDGVLITDVDGDGVGAIAPQFGALGCSTVAVEVGDVDETALLHQALGDLRAKALGATRDEGDAAADLAFPARGGGHLVGLLPHPHDHRQGDVGGDGDGLIEDDGGLSVAGTHQDGAPQRGEEQASDRGCITHDQSLSVQALGAVAASSVASAPSA